MRIVILIIILLNNLYSFVLKGEQLQNFLTDNNVILLTPLFQNDSIAIPDNLKQIQITQVLRGLGYSYKILDKIYAYKKATIFFKYCFPDDFPFSKVCEVYYYNSSRCLFTCSPTNIDFILTYIANNPPETWGYGSVVLNIDN